ncbi:hypothetical protein [Actinoplanes sp. L3-i22]|uniref:hypothetical protein n=1 Tax=Actinoplanes sp. L3-i22 TaxID=2836373 RepID=UPI001C74755D|nr:hypothetical protein [Actinoplanes sp. L3-i22]BCY08140.1 hypothetical protein L3i22_032280 [Actinoplanes sp. L3-i22]
MEARQARANVARFVGNGALGLGFAVALAAALFGMGTPIAPYVLAGLLVITGVGLRLEGAILDRG